MNMIPDEITREYLSRGICPECHKKLTVESDGTDGLFVYCDCTDSDGDYYPHDEVFEEILDLIQ